MNSGTHLFDLESVSFRLSRLRNSFENQTLNSSTRRWSIDSCPLKKRKKQSPMNSKQDQRMATIGALCGIILLVILLGDGLPRTAKLLTVGISLQGLAGLLIHSGLRLSKSERQYQITYLICSLISGLILVSIILLDRPSIKATETVFGMEPATALLVFGITLWPFSFVTLWVLGFYRFVIPSETAKKIKNSRFIC